MRFYSNMELTWLIGLGSLSIRYADYFSSIQEFVEELFEKFGGVQENNKSE
jgi:hypothetical protein